MIGKRISDALKKYKSDGNDLGRPAYGFEVAWIDDGTEKKKRKIVPNQYEQDVLEFIQACRTRGTKISHLNKLLRKIHKPEEGEIFDSLELEDGHTTVRGDHGLSYANIAEILNDYGVTFHDRPWTQEILARLARKM